MFMAEKIGTYMYTNMVHKFIHEKKNTYKKLKYLSSYTNHTLRPHSASHQMLALCYKCCPN